MYIAVDIGFPCLQWPRYCVWYDHLSLLGDEGLSMEWSVEDTNSQRQAEESSRSVHSLQLDLLSVGLLGLIQAICLCLWPCCFGENEFCGCVTMYHVLFLSHASLQWMTQELNTFYLKAMLWVPPNHSLNLWRAVLFALSGACAVKELYDYLSST